MLDYIEVDSQYLGPTQKKKGKNTTSKVWMRICIEFGFFARFWDRVKQKASITTFECYVAMQRRTHLFDMDVPSTQWPNFFTKSPIEVTKILKKFVEERP